MIIDDVGFVVLVYLAYNMALAIIFSFEIRFIKKIRDDSFTKIEKWYIRLISNFLTVILLPACVVMNWSMQARELYKKDKEKLPAKPLLKQTCIFHERLFDIIRKHSLYCSSCGKKLNLPYGDWHLPFCKKCREKNYKAVDNAH